MLATLRRFAIAGPLTLMFSVACWAQTTAFEGDVKGEDGKPLVKVAVHLDRKDIKGNYKVNTDKKGHYYYGGLPIGTYKIWVEVDGKERDSVDNVRSGLGDAKVISFDLKSSASSAASRQAEMQKAIASGGELTKEQTRDMTPEQKAALEKKIKDAAATMAKNKALNDSFNLGKEAMLAKNYDVATDSFKKATEVDATQHVVWASLAEAYVAQAGVKTGADQQAALDGGLQAYQKSIELKPDDAGYHNNDALALAKSKKYAEAQAELQKAAQLDPPNAAKYYYNLGAVLVNTGQNDAAGEAFKKAIDTDPTYADAQFQYATVLSGKLATSADGKVTAPPGMQEALQKYLELRPDGQYADAAKAMLQMVGATIQTNYENPNAPKKKAPPKK